MMLAQEEAKGKNGTAVAYPFAMIWSRYSGLRRQVRRSWMAQGMVTGAEEIRNKNCVDGYDQRLFVQYRR